MSFPKRGEVWLADLGIAAKVRPVLVISVPYSDKDYALITVIPHTTSVRSSSYEIQLNVSRLKPGAFNVQGIFAVPKAKFIRKITELKDKQMEKIEKVLMNWLGL